MTRNHAQMPQGKDIVLLGLAMVGVGTSGPLIAKSTVPVPGIVFWRNFILAQKFNANSQRGRIQLFAMAHAPSRAFQCC